MVTFARKFTLVVLASIALNKLTCSGFKPLSTPSVSKGPTSSTKDVQNTKYAAPSQTPTTTQLPFALSDEEGTVLSMPQRGPGAAVAAKRARTERNGRHRQSVALRDRKRQWVDRSLTYYSTVSREELRRSRGQLPPHPARDSLRERRRKYELAQKHYFALRKIKSGRLDHAEFIYRRIIDEIKNDEEGCDHAKLAVSTLLLALLLQRMGDIKGTRSVFLQFFKVAVLENKDEEKECACSAKVLQAYALFEMKRGHGRKSLEIVEQAVKLDYELRPVLEWKQFREVMGKLRR